MEPKRRGGEMKRRRRIDGRLLLLSELQRRDKTPGGGTCDVFLRQLRSANAKSKPVAPPPPPPPPPPVGLPPVASRSCERTDRHLLQRWAERPPSAGGLKVNVVIRGGRGLHNLLTLLSQY